ncbi:MAG: hypothetical protein WCA35_26545 [Kovacikia sp.]
MRSHLRRFLLLCDRPMPKIHPSPKQPALAAAYLCPAIALLPQQPPPVFPVIHREPSTLCYIRALEFHLCEDSA